MKNKKLLIGLDMGESTGIALYDVMAKKITDVQTRPFWGAIAYINEMVKKHGAETLAVYCEDPEGISSIYARHMSSLLVKLQRRTLTISDIQQVLKIAQNVGGVKILGRRIHEYLLSISVDVVMVTPSNAAKWDGDLCRRITGFQGRTNQHTRDAIRLVYGR